MSDHETPPRKAPPHWWDQLKPLARQMRHEPTLAENRLWQEIRGRKLADAKFRRQHAIERFIVDFYCAEANLVIEVDGESHQYTQQEDEIRQRFLEEVMQLRIIRFSNEQVLIELSGVLEVIHHVLMEQLHPDLLQATDKDAAQPEETSS